MGDETTGTSKDQIGNRMPSTLKVFGVVTKKGNSAGSCHCRMLSHTAAGVSTRTAIANLGPVGKPNARYRSFPIDDDAGSRFPAFEVTQSGNEIKVKRRDTATGLFTPATTLET
jgi:hypothetical protein